MTTVLIILALIFFLVGMVTAAKWLLIFTLFLLLFAALSNRRVP